MPKKERLNKMAQVKPTQQKKMSRPALAALIVSIVLVVAMIVSLVASNGIFTRIKKGAYTENFEINGSMLAYYTASYYQNWYYNNYYYILLGYISFDASKPLSEQYTDSSKTTTYLDQFTNGTKDYVEQVLKYCEAALADKEGYDYDAAKAEAEEYANSSIESLKESARKNSMDLATYIRYNFGDEVSQSDLKKALILEHIASDYANVIYDRIYDAMTEERKDKYFKDNLSTFISAEYLIFTLTETETPNKIDDKLYVTDEYPDGKKNPEYEKAVAAEAERVKVINDGNKLKDQEIIAKFKDLESITDVDERVKAFKKLIMEQKYEASFNTAYTAGTKDWDKGDLPSDEDKEAFRDQMKEAIINAAIEGKKDLTEDKTEDDTTEGEDETESQAEGETKWDKLKKTLPASVITNLNSAVTNSTKTVKYSIADARNQWLFGGVKAEYGIDYTDEENEKNFEHVSAIKGEIDREDKEITDETKKGYGAYTLNVYCVTEPAHRDESATHNVGHILFKVDKNDSTCYATSDEAKAAADKILEQIKATAKDGVVDKDIFEQFGKDNTHDSNVFYENVYEGQMVDEFNDWLFDSERTQGEVDLIETKSYGWHIMFYNGLGEIRWKSDAHDAATDEDVDTWYDELKTTVTINTNLIKTFLGE